MTGMDFTVKNTFLTLHESCAFLRRRSSSAGPVLLRKAVEPQPAAAKKRTSGIRRGGRREAKEAKAAKDPKEQVVEATVDKESEYVHVDTDEETLLYSGLAQRDLEATKQEGSALAQHSAGVGAEQIICSAEPLGASSEPQEFTVMLRNIACSYNKQDLVAYFSDLGLGGTYSKMHLPSNPARHANLGYVFISFTSMEHVQRCMDLLAGKTLGPSSTNKKIEITWAHKGIETASRKTKRRQRLRDAQKAAVQGQGVPAKGP